MGDRSGREPAVLVEGKEFHHEVQRSFAARHGGESATIEQVANLNVDWRGVRDQPPGPPPAFQKGPRGTKAGRFDISILLDAADPDLPVVEGQPPVASYSLLEIKSTHFDGRSLDNVRRIISRHRRQIVKYIFSLVDFSTPEKAGHPEVTVVPGIIYPTAPLDAEVRRFIEELFGEDCISVVWFDEWSGD